MKGYCHLSQIPLRAEARSGAEVVSQMLYGETYEILKIEGEWVYIKMDFDGYEGWLSDVSVHKGTRPEEVVIQHELFDVYPDLDGPKVTSMGAERHPGFLGHQLDQSKDVVELAKRFIGVPYLWGGRTFMGIDCSALVQVAYKCLGVALSRDASQQVKQGKAIRFEDASPGDLAFFESDHKVGHVGIIVSPDRIIHAHGKVRIDRLDKKGIYNADLDRYTHHLHSVRRVR